MSISPDGDLRGSPRMVASASLEAAGAARRRSIAWSIAAAASASLLCATTPSVAALEGGQIRSAIVRPLQRLDCAPEIEVGARDCDSAMLRWRLCQQVYALHPGDDERFFACLMDLK